MEVYGELNPKEIGRRIRKQREKLRLSREDFAELLGLSSYYIGQIERGDRSMSINTLYNISVALNISIDYIIKGETQYMRDILVSESLQNSYKEITDDNIKGIINLLHGSSKDNIKLFNKMIKLILPHLK